MKLYEKKPIPVDQTRRHLEPGPIVLVSSHWRGKSNIQTLGWHMMTAYEQVATYIWDANHSFGMIRKAKSCVINVPTADMAEIVVDIGNCSGAKVDKFRKFGLTAQESDEVSAPLIGECYASFECRLNDGSMIEERGLFIWDVVAAHAAPLKNPKTLHYRGDGQFLVGGKALDMRDRFDPDKL